MSLTESASGSPPIGALAKELVKIQERSIIVSIVLAVVMGLAGPVLVLWLVEGGLPTRDEAIPWIWFAAIVCIASLLLACAVVAFLPALLLRGTDRAASVVHAWIGAREVRRASATATAATKIPTTPDAIDRWLRIQPDSPQLRSLRFELLVMSQRYADARLLIDTFPRSTPLELYRIAEAHAFVDDQTTGDVDETALRAAANRVPAGIDRAEAMASLAVFEARRLVGRGDWRGTLAGARPHIPGGDLVILTRDQGWTIFSYIWPRIVLPVAGLIVLIAVAITVMAL